MLRKLVALVLPLQIVEWRREKLRLRREQIGMLTVRYATARNPRSAVRLFREVKRQIKKLRKSLREIP